MILWQCKSKFLKRKCLKFTKFHQLDTKGKNEYNHQEKICKVTKKRKGQHPGKPLHKDELGNGKEQAFPQGPFSSSFPGFHAQPLSLIVYIYRFGSETK